MKTLAADHIAEFLEAKKIRVAFGIVGAGNARIFDAIGRRGYTEIVCVHHEQAAVMAMGTYYRVSGTVSAAIVTTGAGAANAVTGVVSTWMDSIPGLIISGNENSKFTTDENPLRIWGVQGFDVVKMIEGVTKYSSRVMDPTAIVAELERAYSIAAGGRFGPVWLDVPMNVQAAPVEADELQAPAAVAEDRLTTPTKASVDAMARVRKLLEGSRRPLIWLGHGIRLAGGVDLIEPFVEATNSPALVSWSGIDMVDSGHPHIFGRAGVYGQRHSNFILQNADLVIALGTRMAIPQVGYDIDELAREARIVQVDIDAAELEKYQARIEVGIQLDARSFMSHMLETLPGIEMPERSRWFDSCKEYEKALPLPGPEHEDRDGFINSYPFMDRLVPLFHPDQVVVTDMGTALLSGHQVLRFNKGQRLLTSLGLGEMGFGLPGAVGASFGRQRGEVLCLNCDGGMMMNLQELQTIAHHRLPIKIVVFNNDGYLMIKHTQKSLYGARYEGVDRGTGVSCPDFSALARVFGFEDFQVRTWEDFDDVMPRVMAAKGPVICEVFTHPQQPLVPKLSLAPQKDGSIVSPPLEDLSPFLPRKELERHMKIGVHPKSLQIEDDPGDV